MSLDFFSLFLLAPGLRLFDNAATQHAHPSGQGVLGRSPGWAFPRPQRSAHPRLLRWGARQGTGCKRRRVAGQFHQLRGRKEGGDAQPEERTRTRAQSGGATVLGGRGESWDRGPAVGDQFGGGGGCGRGLGGALKRSRTHYGPHLVKASRNGPDPERASRPVPPSPAMRRVDGAK